MTPPVILLVEDNAGDVRLTGLALKEAGLDKFLHVAVDGRDATDFLRRAGAHEDAPRPDLVLLDLNLPKKSGRDVLAEIRRDPDLRHLPVVVLTSSEAEKDVLMSYNLQATAYLVKPITADNVRQVLQSTRGFGPEADL